MVAPEHHITETLKNTKFLIMINVRQSFFCARKMTGKKTNLAYVLVSAILLVGLSTDVQAVTQIPKWPLKNGDFSAYQGWSRPAGWAPVTISGTHVFTMDPTPAAPINDPGSGVIETTVAGNAYYYQTVWLHKGSYRLWADVSGTPGTNVQLQALGSTGPVVAVDETWQTLELPATVSSSGDNAVYLYALNSASAGTVKFRNVWLEIEQLQDVGAIPLESGGQVGSIVLPASPTLAEQYASYELQRFFFEIFGTTVGVQGRDTPAASGTEIHIGTAVDPVKRSTLDGQLDDSYIVGMDNNTILLAGNTDLGTLYAVYALLRQQGCRWFMPGSIGQILPVKTQLTTGPLLTEIPDNQLRGYQIRSQEFFPGGGWIYIDIDEHMDWAVRNHFNAVWVSIGILDLGAHRGHGWFHLTGHSWNSLLAPYQVHFSTNPEWYALVGGVRKGYSDDLPPNYFPTQFSVSNQSLRDFVVGEVLDYFAANPLAKAFPLNPMDGPTYWCESLEDRALDPALPQQCGDYGTAYLPGDLNLDCSVDILDIGMFALGWLEETPGCTEYSLGDLDQNCMQDMHDFAGIAKIWQQCSDPANPDICGENARPVGLGLPPLTMDQLQEEVDQTQVVSDTAWLYQNVTVDQPYLYSIEWRGMETGTLSEITCQVWGTDTDNGPPTHLLKSLGKAEVDRQGWLRFDFLPPLNLADPATGYFTSSYGTGRLVIALTNLPVGQTFPCGMISNGGTYAGVCRSSSNGGTTFSTINGDAAFRVRTNNLPYPGNDWSSNPWGLNWATDRVLNFANEIAERVSVVYPDKLIELYAYPRDPPGKERVHPSIIIRYADVAGPVGQSLLLDERYTRHTRFREYIGGWVDAGAQNLVLYHYGDWEHPDVSLCWFFNAVDTLKNLRDLFGNSGQLGETSASVQSSAAYFSVLGHALWDSDIDYTTVLADFCNNFYGSGATDMLAYYTLMDEAIRNSDAWKQVSGDAYHPNNHMELTTDTLFDGALLLLSASNEVSGDTVLTQRIAHVRFAHYYLMYVKTGNSSYKNAANSMRNIYGIMVKQATYNQLQ